MTKNLFVRGIPYETTPAELEKFFSSCGQVSGVKIITDRDTGRSKGFGFVEMATEEQAEAAMQKLNGSMLGQRQISVTEARPPGEHAGDAPAPTSAPQPGFVERRSGVRDRRKQPSGSGERKWDERPGGFRGERKPWGPKPGGFRGERKPWDKPGGFGGKKKWDDKPGGFSGEKKPWDRKPGGFAGKKKWDDKPGGFRGEKKPWSPKPGGFGGKKKRKWSGGSGGYGGR